MQTSTQAPSNTKVNTRVVVNATKQEGDVIAHDTMSVSIRLDNGEIVTLQKGLGLYYSKDAAIGDAFDKNADVAPGL